MGKSFLIFVGILLMVAIATPVLAACDSDSDSGCAIKSTEDVLRVLTSIFNFLYDIFLIAAIIMILLAAFNYLNAKDDPKKIGLAHSRIMWALVAIAIALSSMGAVKLIQNFITNK